MGDLGFYFRFGWDHIISRDAFDHLLFVLALSAIYLVGNWKQVLILVTAFTIGHSLTLALSVYDLVRVGSGWVEFLIPCTIIVTALFNFFLSDYQPRSLRLNYFLALFFGLIHGLGFANTIRFTLMGSGSIGWSLFGFNIGLEAGQIVVVTVILLASYLVVGLAGLNRKIWVWSLSALALVAGSMIAWDNFQKL
ncbi:MAG TPA: HupE/UreJ family protein [Ferruginibacter sp.]|nr:HupE/UreJ family protein [Ferruginibacter sp.]